MPMMIIEPCCAKKHLSRLRESIKGGGTRSFECYGDMSLTELMPAMMTRYAEAEMLIACPSFPDQAADAVAIEMRRRWSRADGQGKMDEIAHLTVITDTSRAPQLMMWLAGDTFDGRLKVVDSHREEEYVILLPDFAILGFRNMRYGEHFTAIAITEQTRVDALWERYRGKVSEKEYAAPQETTKAGTNHVGKQRRRKARRRNTGS